MRQVLLGIYQPLFLRVANCYFVKTPLGIEMVDSGVALERASILATAAVLGAPQRVLLTHSHADHAGNAQFLQDRYGTQIVCSEAEGPYLRHEKGLKPRDYTGSPPFAKLIQVGDQLLGHPKVLKHETYETELLNDEIWEFVPIFGHTPGSGGILHKPTRSIFLGDCLINCEAVTLRARVGLHYPFKYFSEDQEAAVRNLAVLKDVNFENAFFGHGPPLLKTAKDEILRFLRVI